AHRRVVGSRPDVLSYALDQVGAPGSAGVDRAFRIGADHPHRAARDLFQVPSGARDGASGADSGDEVGHRPIGLRPDLRARGVVVRDGVLRVRVLIGLPAARYLGSHPAGDTVVGVRVIGRDRAG